MAVKVKRIYEPYMSEDSYRVLVDRLWPRGISKARAHLDAQMKDLAPSTELRKWFGHDPARWEEFKKRYRQELAQPNKQQLLNDLAQKARAETVSLLYGAKDKEHNEALVLKEVLDEMYSFE